MWTAPQLKCSAEERLSEFRQQKYRQWLIFTLSCSLTVCTFVRCLLSFRQSYVLLPEAAWSLCVKQRVFSGCNKGLHYTKKIKQKERVHNEWEKNEWCSGGGKKKKKPCFECFHVERRTLRTASCLSVHTTEHVWKEKICSVFIWGETNDKTINPTTKRCLVWHLYWVLLPLKGITH